jgi:hypothetical protein
MQLVSITANVVSSNPAHGKVYSIQCYVIKFVRDLLGKLVFYIILIFLVPITTKVVSSNPAHGELYSMSHYVIKFVSDLRQVGGFLHIIHTVTKSYFAIRH